MSSPTRLPSPPSAFTRRDCLRLLPAALGGTFAQRIHAAEGPIVIGQVAPYSGTQAVTGKALRAGARLMIEAVNDRGGIGGRPLKLVSRDDQQRPEETVRQVRALIDEHAPVALLGSVGTANIEALARDGVLQRQDMPMIGAASGATTVLAAPHIWPVKASYRAEVSRLFRQMAALGLERVGVLYQDDGFGRDVLAGAAESAQRYELQLTVKAGYARNTLDVAKAVAEVQRAQPQVLFLAATTAAGIEVMRQLRAGPANGTLVYGSSVIDTDALLRALGPEQARGYAFTTVLPLTRGRYRSVAHEYQALRLASDDADLSGRSIEGYVAAKALVRAIEAVVGTPSAARLSSTVERLQVDLGGYALDFSNRSRGVSSYVDFAMLGTGGKVVI
ncbi:ABC transporter substrate-binding protein [Pseudaquabacterium rugosum]|uniref:ABC transporter substrate-binding protein n=1 Tax=Pseudaquabacterium rugosum TaxID=2984194 RepID=A0ABU9BEZ6_9BURK